MARLLGARKGRMQARVQTGLDQLRDQAFKPLLGLSLGLLAHQPSVDAELRGIVGLMQHSGVDLRVIFGPEHGFGGAAQDMEAVPDEAHFGPRMVSLYGSSEASLRPDLAYFDEIDLLVVDLQDVGARYYTYAATMGYAMEAAAKAGIPVWVLDRPNPLGGRLDDLEGPGLKPGFTSFVGAYPLITRHSLTLGEIARWIQQHQKLDLDLRVIPMQGWRRDMPFEATGLPWVMPSPNMPTVDTAWIYPGQCLLEGTNLSEGRGTTRPFELCGAPYLDGEAWAKLAETEAGPGFRLRPTVFQPTHQKHAGKLCGGLQVHVTDRRAARSLRLSVALIWAARELAPEAFAWRSDAYEFVKDRLAIDLLFGSSGPREALEAGARPGAICEAFEADHGVYRASLEGVLLYPEGEK